MLIRLPPTSYAEQIRDLLSEGLALSGLLASRDLESADLQAAVSDRVNPADVKDLRSAILPPSVPPERRRGEIFIVESYGEEIVLSDLVGYLGAEAKRAVVFEHPTLSPSDNRLSGIRDRFDFGDEVYTFLDSSAASRDHVRTALAIATTYLLLAVETRAEAVPDSRHIDIEHLRAIADHATAFWIRAFDGEGYLRVGISPHTSQADDSYGFVART